MSDNFELPSETITKSHKRKKRKARFLLAVIFIAAVFLVSGGILAFLYLPSFKQIHPADYYPERFRVIVMGDTLLDGDYAVVENSSVYLNIEFIREFIDPTIFYEHNSRTVTITANDILMRLVDDEIFINFEKSEFNHTILYNGETAFLPDVFLSSVYPVEINYQPEYDRIIIDDLTVTRQRGVILKNTNLRYDADIKSPIQKKSSVGENVFIFAEVSRDSRGKTTVFSRVRTDDGLLGFILSADIEEGEIIDAISQNVIQKNIQPETPVVMLWDQIYNKADNLSEDKYIVHDALNVLSPTWFSFDLGILDGTIIDTGDLSYTEFAYANNIAVWALLTDNFNAIVGDTLLTRPDTRDYIIDQLLNFSDKYNLDGINIDFEMISQKAAPYYVQFLRELAVFMRENNLILSVDMFVPTYTAHYNRAEVSKIADFKCVMAYGEHYSAVSGSGPVASLPFVEDGITKTLLEVSPDKLILGLPFYTRVWREENGNVSVYKNMAMSYAETLFSENGAVKLWNPEIGSYYAEYSVYEGDYLVTYKAWFEDERSIAEKMELYKKYNLAGIAGWSRNLETTDIWGLFNIYFE